MKKLSNTRRTIQLYLEHTRQHKVAVVLLCLLTATSIIAGQVLTPYVVSLVLDRLSASEGLVLGEFWPLLAFYGALLLTELVAWRIMVYVIWKFEASIIQELIERVYNHLLHQSNRFHTNRFGGALVSQTNKFVGAFERFSDTFFFDIYTFIVYYISILVVLSQRVPMYSVLLVVASALYLSVMVWRTNRQRPLNIAEAQAESSRTAQLADSMTNVATIKSFANENQERKLFHKKALATTQASLRVMRMQLTNDALFNFITSSVGWLALLFAVISVVRYNAPIGTVLLIFSYTANTLRRLWEMSRVTRTLNRAFGDAYDMTEILALKPDVKDAPRANTLKSVRGDVVFDNIDFHYEEQPDNPLFQDLSLHVKPGETIGLVGHSGSGKTTITKLLLRFMDIQNGTIKVDGQNIAKVTQASLRDAIAYVPQEPLMFHRSIAENIRYGRLTATPQEVEAAAKMANAHEFIESLPHGYDTLVGERGTKLSGGQRQRVAIARAMLKNAPILVLDEATSALDSESETLIQEALWKLMEGRTAIVIAHRLSTIQKMDRIIVMDNGKIVEQGSHNELIRTNGVYAKLWAHQSGGFLEE